VGLQGRAVVLVLRPPNSGIESQIVVSYPTLK
jgi:hypothetical protein